MFFVISGLLFFKNIDTGYSWYPSKLISRIKTLAMPYFIWNASYLLFKLLVQSNVDLSRMIGGQSERVSEYSAHRFLEAFLGMESFPISYQFWFIRDLMLLVIVSPFLYWIIRRLPVPALLVVVMLWIMNSTRVLNISYASILFFTAGGCCSIHRGLIERIANLQISSLICTAIVAIDLGLASSIAYGGLYGIELSKILVLPNMLVTYKLAQMISAMPTTMSYVRMLSPYGFFIYAAHEPTLGMVFKAISRLSQTRSGVVAIIEYVFLPLLLLLALVLLAKTIQRALPNVFNVVTGGRGGYN